MTFLIRTDAMADSIEMACDLVAQYGSGLAVNYLLDQAEEAADDIRQLDERTEMPVRTLEAAQTVLRIAQMVADTQTAEMPDYSEQADVLGSAIWGAAPKGETSRISPE